MGPRQGSERGERGATLVESALITPILLLFVFGIFEYGFAFRSYLGVANTVRDGAREASVAADAGDADYRMLRAVERGSAALRGDALERIVIWKASGPDDTVPATCAGGTPVIDLCNVYSASSLAIPEVEFGCQKTANGDPYDSPDQYWCPIDRQVVAGSGLDFVGIHVTTTHRYITGLFGDDIVISDDIVLKVEPQDR